MSDAEYAYVLEDVEFSHGAVPALRVPRLEIARGRITTLTGANGSGKTTLLHLLGFIETPHTGRLRFLGEPTRPRDAERLRRQVGLLLQDPYLFHTSVLANVECGLRIRGHSASDARSRSRAALELVGLAGFERRRASRLSGGEARRVALARVLAFETDVLLLDEPLAHVDRAIAGRIEDLIVELNERRGVTVVLATHDLSWAQAVGHHVISLHEGTIVPTSLANVFRGKMAADGTHFDTGRITIYIPGGDAQCTHLAIDPAAIVLSNDPLESSMRNTFRGKIVAIRQQNAQVRVEIDAGERFAVLITRASLNMFDLHLGDEPYLSFKSTAAKVF